MWPKSGPSRTELQEIMSKRELDDPATVAPVCSPGGLESGVAELGTDWCHCTPSTQLPRRANMRKLNMRVTIRREIACPTV
jgi:hypothetical protein